MKIYKFRIVPLSIISRFFTVHTAMVFVMQVCWPLANRILLASGQQTLWHILLLCVQWKTPVDGQRNCPKHVEFYSKNKFKKLVHLVGFIIRNVTRRTVTWTSNIVVLQNTYDTKTLYSFIDCTICLVTRSRFLPARAPRQHHLLLSLFNPSIISFRSLYYIILHYINCINSSGFVV
jgi:hypothetical protein